jgi:hypothetical protein
MQGIYEPRNLIPMHTTLGVRDCAGGKGRAMRVGSQNDPALLLKPKIFAHFSHHCRCLADWDGPHDLAGSANVFVATINF